MPKIYCGIFLPAWELLRITSKEHNSEALVEFLDAHDLTFADRELNSGRGIFDTFKNTPAYFNATSASQILKKFKKYLDQPSPDDGKTFLSLQVILPPIFCGGTLCEIAVGDEYKFDIDPQIYRSVAEFQHKFHLERFKSQLFVRVS